MNSGGSSWDFTCGGVDDARHTVWGSTMELGWEGEAKLWTSLGSLLMERGRGCVQIKGGGNPLPPCAFESLAGIGGMLNVSLLWREW